MGPVGLLVYCADPSLLLLQPFLFAGCELEILEFESALVRAESGISWGDGVEVRSVEVVEQDGIFAEIVVFGVVDMSFLP